MQQKTVQPPNLTQDVKSGKILPIYLISGEETFLVSETVKKLVDLLLEPSTRDFNFDVFDGSQTDLREIFSAVEVYPTMADRRVILVNEPTFLVAGTSKSTDSTSQMSAEETIEPDDVHIANPLFTGTIAEPNLLQTESTEEFSDLDPKEQFLSWFLAPYRN